MKEFLSSAQFAKLCHVNKKTLFYYDEIGLLKPYQVNEKGYRIYHYQQIEDMSVIKAMQTIGMSLDEIRNLMYMETSEEYMSMLEEHIEQLNNKQKELREAKQMLAATADNMKEYQKYGCNQMFTEIRNKMELETYVMEGNMINFITSKNAPTVIVSEERNGIVTCRKAKHKTGSSISIEGGIYASVFISRDSETIEEMCAQYHQLLDSLGIETSYPYFISMLTNHLLPCKEVSNIYKVSGRVKQ